jgi:hypothetical protein
MDRKPDQWPLPASMSIAESPDLLVITYRWNKFPGYVMLFFGVTFALVFCPILFVRTDANDGSGLLGILLFLAFIVFLLYTGLAYVLNATTITIGFEELTIKHPPIPIPWVNSLTISRGDIKQLYTRQNVMVSTAEERKSVSYSYSVNAVVQGQKDIALFKVFDTAEEAKFVEQKIEQYLKIKNQKMPGEYRG